MLPTEFTVKPVENTEGQVPGGAGLEFMALSHESYFREGRLAVELPETQRERNALFENLADNAFSEEELLRWDRDTRRAMLGLSSYDCLRFVDSDYANTGGCRGIVVDLENLKKLKIRNGAEHDIGPIMIPQNPLIYNLAVLSERIGVVVSEEDYREGGKYDTADAKSLFYVPRDKRHALQARAVKKEQFHLGLWEVNAGKYPDYYPTKDPYNPVSTQEAIICALIFKVGEGYRDELGRLMVKYSNGTIRPISTTFFTELGYLGKSDYTEGLSLTNKPKPYLRAYCQDLLEQGEIQLTDFRGMQKNGSFESMRLTGRSITDKGQVMIGSARYYFGQQYADGNYQINQLSPDLAVISKRTRTDKNPASREIVQVVRLLSEDELEQLDSRYYGGYKVVGKKVLDEQGRLMNLEVFSQEYPESIDMLRGWGDFVNFSSNLESLGIPVFKYSLSEQALLWDIYNTSEGPGLVQQLVGNPELSVPDRIDRLRCLLVLEPNLSDIEILVEIAQDRRSNFLFDNLSAISEITGTFDDFIGANKADYSDVELDRFRQIKEMITRHASRIFLAAGDILKEPGQISLQDVSHVLYRYRRGVERMYQGKFLRGTDDADNRYLMLVHKFDEVEGGTNMQTVLLSMIEEFWVEDIMQERGNGSKSALKRIKTFYEGNKALFDSASETTGDTERDLYELRRFFDKFESVDGYVLDLACGDRKRITEPMAQMLKGKAKVIGMDIWSPGKNNQENLDVVQGSIDSIPLPDNSVAIATMVWSPPNDWVTRTEQTQNFGEVARVIKGGGTLRFDVAYLEGGTGGWEQHVDSLYQSGKSDKYGDMMAEFPGGREGRFHIYPLGELKAMLVMAGFTDIDAETWVTGSGKPRVTVTARKSTTQNPLH